jgi:spore germination protein KA/spore germination protein
MPRTTRDDRYNSIIKALSSADLDIAKRPVSFEGGELTVLYIKQLTDISALSLEVIKPLVERCAKGGKGLTAREVMESVIYSVDCTLEEDDSNLIENILAGMCVLLFSTEKNCVVINLKKVEHRDITTPDSSYALRAPKDSFTENLDVNLSLIRYRVKDPNIRIRMLTVGRRTRTRVAVLYIEDIANDTVVNEVQKRIARIDVDGIGESGELQALMLNNKRNLFPQMGLLERSDMAYNTLMEGKVITLVDGSPTALVAPKVFVEFFHSCDDRYDNRYFGLFMRVIRYIALGFMFTASSLYVAVVSFNTGVLPSEYAIALAQMRSKVPFAAFVGALVIEFLVELVREGLLRVPKQIGPAVGIVGTIIIGQAAIAAGIFSPLLLIIASISLLASFAVPDYSMVHPFRILKFALLLCTGTFGFFGFVLCISLVLINLVSINSYGVPFMSPYAPFNLYDFIRTFIFNISASPLRPRYLRDKDRRRAR